MKLVGGLVMGCAKGKGGFGETRLEVKVAVRIGG